MSVLYIRELAKKCLLRYWHFCRMRNQKRKHTMLGKTKQRIVAIVWSIFQVFISSKCKKVIFNLCFAFLAITNRCNVCVCLCMCICIVQFQFCNKAVWVEVGLKCTSFMAFHSSINFLYIKYIATTMVRKMKWERNNNVNDV